MALERANPLPPNQRYWVDVSPEDQPAFDEWLAAYAVAVHVVATNRDGSSGWQWVLFDVSAPLVFWAGPGYPTIADASVTTESQVKQVPRPAGASSTLPLMLIGAGVALGAVALIKRLL